MKFSTSLMALSAAAAGTSATTIPSTFYLETKGADKFNNLFLSLSHSGASTNDALFVSDISQAGHAYKVPTNETAPDGTPYFNLQFDVPGVKSPYQLVLEEGVNTYAGWAPTSINIGGLQAGDAAPSNGFSVDSAGTLQWTDSPDHPESNSFGGWLADFGTVCDWWRGAPQLFSIVNGFNTPFPDSCALVDLQVVYQAE